MLEVCFAYNISAGVMCTGRFLYSENHSLSEWFKKAYGDKEKPSYNN